MTIDVIEFIRGQAGITPPPEAVYHAKRSLLDLIGVWAAGRTTDLSRIIHDHAADQFGPGGSAARLMFDGRRVSPAGAALAGGMTIDSVDAHDGYKPAKGHAGCHVLPSLLAIWQAQDRGDDGAEFLDTFIMGYEIACRVAEAQHDTVPDYHSSGSWGAVACAAVGARLLDLDTERTRHALGIGEYHGPRAQMMRLIDHPTMLKDSSGWGSMAGTSAAFMAAGGFTGAPALTIESDECARWWQDLGTRWTMCEQYFKPWPVCRWAQPPAEAALRLCEQHHLTADQIERVSITTFHEAVRLAGPKPQTTEEAQYSIAFPVAAALVHGDIGMGRISGAGLGDEQVLSLAARVDFLEDEGYQAAFPARRLAHIDIHLKDGSVLTSPPTEARGDPEDPLSDGEVIAKFDRFAVPVLGADRAAAIEESVGALDAPGLDLAGLRHALTPSL